MANGILIGSLVRLAAAWRVPATPQGTLTDPTTVTLTIRLPDGSQVVSAYGGATAAGTITKDATGLYHADYLPLTEGEHRWRWAGTGAAHAPDEGKFTIRGSSL